MAQIRDTPDMGPRVIWGRTGITNPFSGIGVYALNLAKQLQFKGVTPFVFGPPSGKEIDQYVHYMPSRWPLLFLEQRILSKVCAAFDVADAGKAGYPMVYHGLANINIARFRNQQVKTVLTVHDVIPLLAEKTKPLYRTQFLLGLRHSLGVADRIICVSEWTRHTLEVNFPTVQDKIVVIRNGVQPITWLPETHEQHDVPVVTTISRYEPYKNLAIIPEILDKTPVTQLSHFNLVTDEHGKRLMNELAPGQIATGRLKIYINIDDQSMAKLWQETDLYIHPSLFEGFCLPVADALGRGIPVVFKRGHAVDELVKDGVSGVGVSSASDIEEWLTAMQRALALKLDALAIKDSLPTWESAANELVSLYNDLT